MAYRRPPTPLAVYFNQIIAIPLVEVTGFTAIIMPSSFISAVVMSVDGAYENDLYDDVYTLDDDVHTLQNTPSSVKEDFVN